MRASRSYSIREAMLPGPVRGSGYRTVVLVGSTGSGKTTLLRQLIGVDGAGERFPSVSVAKTTTAETEVLLAPGDYYAVATFRPREEVRLLVAECLHRALGALLEGRSEAEAERALLVHSDQRFHLRYLLGPAEGTGVVDLRGARWTVEVLDGLRQLADPPAGPGNGDRLWAAPAFAAVVDEVVAELSRRVGRLPGGTLRRGPDGWPVAWHHTCPDQDELLERLALLAGNDSRRYGRLVSPLVDGLRVRGPFRPLGVAEVPYLVLVDTEGLGHTPASATRLPARLAETCRRADWIVLVDNAVQPFQAATIAALREIVAAGGTDRLLLVFTHVDQLQGPNLRSAAARRDFLRACRDQAIEHLGTTVGLDGEARRRLVRRLDSFTYFFGERDQHVAPGAERRPPAEPLGSSEAAAEPDWRSRLSGLLARPKDRRDGRGAASADPQLGTLIRDLQAIAAPGAAVAAPAATCSREDLADAVDAAVEAFKQRWLHEVRSGSAHGGAGADGRRARRPARAGRRARDGSGGGGAPARLANGVVAEVLAVVANGAAREAGARRMRSLERFLAVATAPVLRAAQRWVGELTGADWRGIAQLSNAEAEYAALARLLDRQLGLDWGQGFVPEAFAAIEQALTSLGFVVVDDAPDGAGCPAVEDRLDAPRLDAVC